MSKVIIFSDLHIHPWTAFSSLDKRGVNTRLRLILSCLKKIIKAAQTENASAILFSGDLFHVSRLSAETYDLTTRVLRSSQHPIVMIPGNHDQARKISDYHTMRALNQREGFLYVLDQREGQSVKINGISVAGIPFTESRKDLYRSIRKIRDIDVLLLHTGFAGATAGFDYIADQKNFAQPHKMGLAENEIKIAVAGHFHRPQIWYSGSPSFDWVTHPSKRFLKPGMVLVPGAPLQHTFGDQHDERGYWVADLKKNRLRFRSLEMPKFYKIDMDLKEYTEEELAKISKGNYIALSASRLPELERGSRVLEETASGYTAQKKKSKTNEKSRLNVGLETGYKEALKAYLKKEKPEGLKIKNVLKVGLELLSKAEEEA